MLLVSGVYYNLYNVLQDEKGAAVNATAPCFCLMYLLFDCIYEILFMVGLVAADPVSTVNLFQKNHGRHGRRHGKGGKMEQISIFMTVKVFFTVTIYREPSIL